MIGWLAEFTLEGAAVLLLTGVALAALGARVSAAVRHAAWSTALALQLLLAGLALVSPVVELPVAPLGMTGERAAIPRPAAPAASPAIGAPIVDGSSRGAVGGPTDFPSATSMLVAAWLAGALLVLARSVRARIALGRLRRRARACGDVRTGALVAELRGRLGLSPAVVILESDEVAVPVAFGTLRPVVLLPPGTETWSRERLRVALIHELSHVRRGDAWTQLVAEVARALAWHDPLAWHAWRRLLVERERACDDEVVAVGASPADYAGHLLALARRASLGAPHPAGALLLSELAGLRGRVHALLAPAARRKRLDVLARVAIVSPALVLGTLCALVGGARGRAIDRAEEPGLVAHTPPPSPSIRAPEPARPRAERTTVVPTRSTAPAASAAPAAAAAAEDPFADPRTERADVADPGASGPSDEEIARAPERDRILVLREASLRPRSFEHDYVGERARWALTRVRDGRVVAPLVESLDDPDWRLQAYAAWALAAVGAREAAPAIRPLLDHPNWRVRAQAGSSLLDLEGSLPADRLDRLAADAAWQVRWNVVESLRRRGGAGARERLERMKGDPHAGTRLSVEDALARLGSG
jgi:beta-lactamase regulating signal transducer with metallopeptidase domain